MKNIPGPNRFALILALLLPVYFAFSALGAKVGIWGWQTGLGSLIGGAGPFLLGIVALVGVVTLIMAVRKAPRTGWWASLIAIIIPLGAFAYLGSVGETAGANPIHDVATDTANPPTFSKIVMGERNSPRPAGPSNPINDYATPLGEIDMYSNVDEPLKSQSHAQVISELYPDLGPILINAGEEAKALAAVQAAMEEMGFVEIQEGRDAAHIEGIAETFWFGFKDDVVARVANGRIDFRSVSRVGRSDLGANADRIADLRAKTEANLTE